jgi:hypothetical protein
MAEKELKILHQILANEQQLLQRTDQKAYTLLSIIGVFMVFFIVHFTKVPGYLSVVTMTFFYLLSALISITYLMMVIVPRIKNAHVETGEEKTANPTFFAGIINYESVEKFTDAVRKLSDNDEQLFKMFASSLYTIAHINAHKSKYLRKAIISFVITITIELSLIFVLYVHLYRQRVLPLGM